MHHDDSGNDSDELDEFEESMDDRKTRPPIKNHAVTNKHYDEEYEVSQDLSVAESFDGRDKVMYYFSPFLLAKISRITFVMYYCCLLLFAA